MNLSMSSRRVRFALTPALSRQREREKSPLFPVNGGEGWGERCYGASLLSRQREREKSSLSPVSGGEGWGEGCYGASLLNIVARQA